MYTKTIINKTCRFLQLIQIERGNAYIVDVRLFMLYGRHGSSSGSSGSRKKAPNVVKNCNISVVNIFIYSCEP